MASQNPKKTAQRKAAPPVAPAPRAPRKKTSAAAAAPPPPTRKASAPAPARPSRAGLAAPKATAPAAAANTQTGATQMNRILFIDLAERDRNRRAEIRVRIANLERIENTKARSGGLGPDLKKELDDLKAQLAKRDTTDELYRGVAEQVAGKPWELLSQAGQTDYVMRYGFMGSQYGVQPNELGVEEKEILAVCGLLLLDGIQGPDNLNFVSKVTIARGEFEQNRALFMAAFNRFTTRHEVTLRSQIEKGYVDQGAVGFISGGGIGSQGTGELVPAANDRVDAVSSNSLAAIVRRIRDEGISPNDPWLVSRMDNAFNLLTGMVEGAPPSALEIMLPDLEEAVDVEIQKENLQASQAIYFSYQLEEMRMFQVVDKIVDLFRGGLLPLGKGTVGDKLFKYFKTSTERITEAERRELYYRMFGAPGGNPNAGEPNRDFNELWLRFVSAVSSFARQISVERLLRNNVPMAVSQEQVRKAARDLGANLSRNGYGIAYFAATELQNTIISFRDILQDPDLRSAFGARDMWQVIDMVNVNYLGGAKNTHRFRTQSRAGAIIIRWISENIQRLANISGPVLSIDEISNPQMRIASGANPTLKPTDWDLVNACEQWLAVMGVQEQSVEQYSQPIEAPAMTSRPIDMPQAARDVLASVGVNLPV